MKPMWCGGKGKQYATVRLIREGGGYEDRKLHILVLEAFVGPRPDGMVGRHKNDIKSDNRLDNLCWGTQSENAIDRVRHGRGAQQKLTHDQRLEIKRRRMAGESGRALAREFGVSDQTVCSIYKGLFKSVEGA